MTAVAITHVDDVVLGRFVTYLLGIPGLEDHVTDNEDEVPEQIEAPWAWVHQGDEDIPSQNLSRKKTRTLTVYVDLITSANREAMKQANAIAARIENRIDADPRLGGIVGMAALQGLTRAREETLSVARVRMIYAFTFWTAAGAAETPI